MLDDLHAKLQPVVGAVGLDLVDVELKAGVLLVTVDGVGGVDLAALTDANRAVSSVLDDIDPIPGRYTLEVSSPGVERTLRMPAHFVKAVGETVTVKTRPQVPCDRRLRGRLLAADDGGFELERDGTTGERTRLAYSDIDRVRTVFVWGSEARTGVPGAKMKSGEKQPRSQEKQARPQEKRKQVVTP